MSEDIEGEWIRLEAPNSHYGKLLSTETAWHVHAPERLCEATWSIVSEVELKLSAKQVIIHYDPGLRRLRLTELREMANPTGPLVAWRAAFIGLELSRGLLELHELDLPQMVIHPERIGRLGDRIVLTPTMAGALPPLSGALAKQTAGWLCYVAPEVLRTRALNRDLLFAGDVYALGRTLEALCVTAAVEFTPDPFDLAVRRVETRVDDPLGDMPPAMAELQLLIRRMCALIPDQRPQLPEVIAEMETIIQQRGPERATDGLKPADLKKAEAIRDDLQGARQTGVFPVTARQLHLVNADVMMLQTPPDCGRAVLELAEADPPRTYKADVQLRLGRVYSVFKNYEGHLKRSAEAYGLAARLFNWAPEVVEEWLAAMSRLQDPRSLLLATETVPPVDLRSPRVLESRMEAWLKMGEQLRAWNEIAGYLSSRGMDSSIADLARKLARQVPPNSLRAWLKNAKQNEEHPAASEIARTRLSEV